MSEPFQRPPSATLTELTPTESSPAAMPTNGVGAVDDNHNGTVQAAPSAPPATVALPTHPATVAPPFAAAPLFESTPPVTTATPTPPVSAAPPSLPPQMPPAVAVSNSSLPPREPIAPDVPRPNTTQPLVYMLIGAVFSCVLIGFGMLLQSRGHGGAADPLGYGGAVSSESGNAIVQAVRRVGPAVLNVDSKFGKGAPLEFLPSPGTNNQPTEGKGTGFIINSKRGLMLTNAHVVAGAQNIQVTTRDGDVYTGRIIGTDRMSDVAVVEVSNKSLPEAHLANLKNARDLAIGQWAIAIGNPFAQANTVTVGVVSAVGRAIPVPGHNGMPLQLTDMIQTDAAINPGNSGGPLCNIRGEVIGINTAIYGIGTGLGFSIPINKAKAVADQLISKGRVSHPYIGIHMQPVTGALQTDLGLKDSTGALVQGVEPKSPAAKAQLQTGDVIRAVDGQKMKSSDDVQRYIGGKAVGDIVKIEVARNGSVKKILTLKIGDRPDDSDEPVAPPKAKP